jgi:uncharacterized protein YggE
MRFASFAQIVTASILFNTSFLPLSYADTPGVPKVSASGEYTVSIEATKAIVSFQVSRTGATAKEASEKNARAADSVVSFLKNQSNVKKLQTTGINLAPITRYDNQTNQPQITGYESRNDLQFETSIDTAGALLDQIIQKGANNISSVNFSAEESALEEARKKAVSEATKNAKMNAELAASAIGVTPKSVYSININQSNRMPIFMRSQEMAFSAKMAADTPVVGGSLSVSASVSVELSL